MTATDSPGTGRAGANRGFRRQRSWEQSQRVGEVSRRPIAGPPCGRRPWLCGPGANRRYAGAASELAEGVLSRSFAAYVLGRLDYVGGETRKREANWNRGWHQRLI